MPEKEELCLGSPPTIDNRAFKGPSLSPPLSLSPDLCTCLRAACAWAVIPLPAHAVASVSVPTSAVRNAR